MGWTQHGLMRLVDVIRGYKALNSVRPFCLKEYSLFDRQLHKRPSPLRRIWSAVAAATMLTLSACVELQIPLLTDTQPLLGQQFEVHLYENFVDGKALDFHTSIYRWKDDKYVRGSGLARDITSFVVKLLEGNDFIIQGTNESERLFNYWIGRRLIYGVYLVFPLDETDVDAATRNAVCAKDQPGGVCMIQTYDQLITLAHGTAAKPVRDPALAVILVK